jgi:hypothetical protein
MSEEQEQQQKSYGKPVVATRFRKAFLTASGRRAEQLVAKNARGSRNFLADHGRGAQAAEAKKRAAKGGA